jgi:hypothetical protein
VCEKEKRMGRWTVIIAKLGCRVASAFTKQTSLTRPE